MIEPDTSLVQDLLYRPMTPLERQSNKHTRNRWEVVRILSSMGLTDPQIAEHTGLTCRSIVRIRAARKIPSPIPRSSFKYIYVAKEGEEVCAALKTERCALRCMLPKGHRDIPGYPVQHMSRYLQEKYISWTFWLNYESKS